MGLNFLELMFMQNVALADYSLPSAINKHRRGLDGQFTKFTAP
jgi:hypothetical protein